MARKISEAKFRKVLYPLLERVRGKVNSVTGPGRSGAIAAVYASHYLGIPFIPFYRGTFDPKLAPVLIVDTAIHSGRTMRKAERRVKASSVSLVTFVEPPIVRFWYERFHKGYGYSVKFPSDLATNNRRVKRIPEVKRFLLKEIRALVADSTPVHGEAK